MEDIRAYIESGILELYVLGDVSPAEKQQVDDAASKYPEVKAELDAIETAMESYALVQAIEPSEQQRDRVLNSLLVNLGDDRTFTKGRAHSDIDDKIIPMQPRTGINFYKYAFAACLFLLLVSIAALVSIYNRLQQSNELISSLQDQNQRFSSQVNLMDEQISVFRDPSFRFIKLKGTPKTPASAITVAWSPSKKKVMIDMADLKLPENDQQHQYQLWAIVAGKPVDLGLFDAKTKSDTSGMKEMKSVEAPQAFAVTLEPRGGSVNPTMEAMIVMSAI
ncbi:anti-sigma factor [Mucilaginibacter sp. UR6-1]|uniref:anti-sigma factor n=1 Tax=Mucilaginibacter sp. UR6-1 TaxID=1435643 RepID=UPI001E4AFDB6|nr:anti-sigma factor [Mucilaginibacter sp. UR6-1]MCC8410719.1 anti-sigma factor [Mucilaginibacter sp. UR6-1]